jgi:oxygen-independent coproporphyrinogen III oxidase
VAHVVETSFPSESEWPDLLARYDRPLPRYTSYPPVPAWHDDPIAAREHVWTAAARADGIALYVHVPFCPSLCWYCACNRFITKDTALVDEYLDALESELDALAQRIGHVRLDWLHWGGGTPNSLSFEQISRLFRAVATRFALADDAEISAEIDPRLASEGQIALFASLGFNRLSVGVQDFQEATQTAIHRTQSFEQTKATIDWAREFEIGGINIDCIYGLPKQTRASFATTVAQVLSLQPDRVAAYAYAHVPWVNPAQRAYEDELPDRLEKFGMIVDAVRTFDAGGYQYVGIDHFAAPDDALAAAARNGWVSRTFMGYSPRRPGTLIGVGASAISASSDAFVQNEHDVKRYIEALGGDALAQRGCLLTSQDLERQAVIEAIMTLGRVDANQALPLLIDAEVFESLVRDGLVHNDGKNLALAPVGRLFARNLASCFDAYRSPLDARHASGV